MSRELYDLCRRYKHFYKKHQDVRQWSRKYHDLNLQRAIDTSTLQLSNAKNKLQIGLFKEFGVHCNSIDKEYEMIISWFPKIQHSRTDVEFLDSDEFLFCLAMYMEEMTR